MWMSTKNVPRFSSPSKIKYLHPFTLFTLTGLHDNSKEICFPVHTDGNRQCLKYFSRNVKWFLKKMTTRTWSCLNSTRLTCESASLSVSLPPVNQSVCHQQLHSRLQQKNECVFALLNIHPSPSTCAKKAAVISTTLKSLCAWHAQCDSCLYTHLSTQQGEYLPHLGHTLGLVFHQDNPA